MHLQQLDTTSYRRISCDRRLASRIRSVTWKGSSNHRWCHKRFKTNRTHQLPKKTRSVKMNKCPSLNLNQWGLVCCLVNWLFMLIAQNCMHLKWLTYPGRHLGKIRESVGNQFLTVKKWSLSNKQKWIFNFKKKKPKASLPSLKCCETFGEWPRVSLENWSTTPKFWQVNFDWILLASWFDVRCTWFITWRRLNELYFCGKCQRWWRDKVSNHNHNSRERISLRGVENNPNLDRFWWSSHCPAYKKHANHIPITNLLMGGHLE